MDGSFGKRNEGKLIWEGRSRELLKQNRDAGRPSDKAEGLP